MAAKRNIADNKVRAPAQSLACLGERDCTEKQRREEKKEANPKYEVKQVTKSGLIWSLWLA